MIGKIPQPIKPVENKPEDVAQCVKDLAKWNPTCDSLEGAS